MAVAPLAQDPTEFDRLIRDYARVMAAAIRRVCGRKYGSLAPDVQQEVYLALWKRLHSGKQIDHPISYLYKVALTTALAMVRKIESENPGAEVLEPDARAMSGGSGLTPMERSQFLSEMIGTLEPDEIRAVRAYLAGYSHNEVAQLYGWTESVARHRIYRSIERLRAKMREGTS